MFAQKMKFELLRDEFLRWNLPLTIAEKSNKIVPDQPAARSRLTGDNFFCIGFSRLFNLVWALLNLLKICSFYIKKNLGYVSDLANVVRYTLRLNVLVVRHVIYLYVIIPDEANMVKR